MAGVVNANRGDVHSGGSLKTDITSLDRDSGSEALDFSAVLEKVALLQQQYEKISSFHKEVADLMASDKSSSIHYALIMQKLGEIEHEVSVLRISLHSISSEVPLQSWTTSSHGEIKTAIKEAAASQTRDIEVLKNNITSIISGLRSCSEAIHKLQDDVGSMSKDIASIKCGLDVQRDIQKDLNKSFSDFKEEIRSQFANLMSQASAAQAVATARHEELKRALDCNTTDLRVLSASISPAVDRSAEVLKAVGEIRNDIGFLRGHVHLLEIGLVVVSVTVVGSVVWKLLERR